MEPGLREHLVNKKKMFAPYFRVSEVEFPSGKKKKAFHCIDPPGLKMKVFKLKKIQDDPGWIPLVGIDKGKKWLKCTVEWLRLLDDQSPPLKKQRVTREEGILGTGRGKKDSGHPLLLALVESLEEGYEDLLVLLDLCQVKLLAQIMFSGDFKVYMFLLGKYLNIVLSVIQFLKVSFGYSF